MYGNYVGVPALMSPGSGVGQVTGEVLTETASALFSHFVVIVFFSRVNSWRILSIVPIVKSNSLSYFEPHLITIQSENFLVQMAICIAVCQHLETKRWA